MKLLDLLVRDLNEWPEDANIIMQDGDGSIGSYSMIYDYQHCEWSEDIKYHNDPVERTVLATDHQTAIITKEMWEQAK